MQCAESLRVQAYFDGEVDAPSAAELERHIERCAECRILLQDLGETRAAIRRDLTVHRAPPELRARITRALDHEAAVPNQRAARVDRSMWRARPFWAGALGGVGVSAAAAMLVFLSLSPSPTNALLDDVVAAHVASLAPSRLIEVESTDRHTVKPWFQGKIPFAFDLPELQNTEFSLLGARMTYLDQVPGAHLIYEAGKHRISVFIFQQGALPGDLDANSGAKKKLSFNLETWEQGGLRYFVIGDASAGEITKLSNLFKSIAS